MKFFMLIVCFLIYNVHAAIVEQQNVASTVPTVLKANIGELCASNDDCHEKNSVCALNTAGQCFVCQIGCDKGIPCKTELDKKGVSFIGKCKNDVCHS